MKHLTLNSPVKIAGVEVKKLSIREPKVRDHIAAEKTTGTEGEREVAMMANLCEVDPEVIMDLSMKDYRSLQDVYKGFLS